MNKTSDTSVPLVVNVNKDVNKELIEIGVKNEKSISIRPKYAGEVPRRIYDLTEYFKLTGQLEEVNRAGWSVNFGAFMDANPAGVFDDDRHLYNALKTFRGVNGKAKAFEL